MSEPNNWQTDNPEQDENINEEDLRYAPVDTSDDDDTSNPDEFEMLPDENSDDDEDESRTFEDLTLAELTSQLIASPRRTWRAIKTVASAPREATHISSVPIPITPVRRSSNNSSPAFEASDGDRRQALNFRFNRKQIQLGLYLIAFVLGLLGSMSLLGPGDVRRTESNALALGAPFLWMAFFTWIGAELYGNWESLIRWWNKSDRLTQTRWALRIIPVFVWLSALFLLTDSMIAPAEFALGLVQVAISRIALGAIFWIIIEVGVWIMLTMAQNNQDSMTDWVILENHRSETNNTSTQAFWNKISLTRLFLFIMATASSIFVWIGTPSNQIPPPVIALWFLSAGLWGLVFAPLEWSVFDWATNKIDAIRRINWKSYSWAIIAFALIMILGMGFRLAQLDSLPPEMTSDHVEKVLDSNRVFNGEFNIFFANNGGREPIQMYLMSLFTQLPGLDFNHYTLKLLAALQSLITLPILFWLGVEIMGKERRQFGVVVGLLLAGFVAVSYWHVAISRQALRIVMTPIFASLLLIYLSRAMRYNKRSDFVKTALILGFGLYAYQAVRMLPVVVVAGITIAIVIRSISWRERLMYGVNLMVLVFISFMVFLPMFHYSLEDPDHFWRRTAGRILGDDLITEQRPDGSMVERQATPEERTEAFNTNVPILMTNVRNALLMFNWKGDVGWISGVPNEPAMDIYAGTFLILGIAGWGVMMVKSRDPVIWLIPVMVLIMLLPSALSIAYPLENPSHTRTSGAIPAVYLMVAFPLAMIVFRFVEAFSKRTGAILAVLLCSSVLVLANQQNTKLYFDRYPPVYIDSSYPYSEAGNVLNGFAESDGAYGNAFMIAYPHWWGHRAIGIASGEPFWPNGIINLTDVPSFLYNSLSRQDKFKLDPNKDLLFFYSPDDEFTSLQLKEWFPYGREQEVQSYQPDDKYRLYRVPFLGEDGFQQFIADNP